MATPAARRRRSSARKSARTKKQDALWVVGGIGLFLLIAAVRWVNTHRGISALVVAILLVVGAWKASRVIGGRLHAHRSKWLAPTDLRAYLTASPDEFEQQTAALCRRDGCRDVRVVGGAGDLAADVLATAPTGRRILIQCKRYRPGNLVGSDHIQRVNGTYRDIHGCDQAIIVTTSGYTRDAVSLARRVNMRLYAAPELEAWARGGRPPWN